MRTTTYRAPDKRRGYDVGDLRLILSNHDDAARVKIRPGWAGQPQVVIIEEDEPPEPVQQYAQHIERLNDYADRCETPPPAPEAIRQHMSGRGVDDALQGSLDATDDEEWLREQLRERGVPVHIVEAVARRGMLMDERQARDELVAYGVDLAVIDDISSRYRNRVRAREFIRRGGHQ